MVTLSTICKQIFVNKCLNIKNSGEGFSITVDLKRHVETPIVDKPNSCKKCGAGFSLSQSL